MEALRVRAKPGERRIIIELPEGVDANSVEVIFLSEKKELKTQSKHRKPSPKLSGTIINDELIDPACPETEWDSLQ